jgi:ornithine carbamoyltransferase
MPKHFLDVHDFSKKELMTLIHLCKTVKEFSKEKALPDLLYKKTIAMIFEEASTRTIDHCFTPQEINIGVIF